MKTTVIVPPIKCQGIKTKLVSSIKSLADHQNFDRWIEPFCGLELVAFNLYEIQLLKTDYLLFFSRISYICLCIFGHESVVETP